MSVGSAVNFSTEARLSDVGDLVRVDFEVEVESCSPCSGFKAPFRANYLGLPVESVVSSSTSC